jgi:hypothetical protein
VPLAAIGQNATLHRALGAVFHLELLEPDDEPRIEAANQAVWDWFGPELKYTWLSCWNEIEPIRRRDLDYASSFTTALDAPQIPGDQATSLAAQSLEKLSHTEYHVACTGAEHPQSGSPFSYRFWSEIPEVDGGARYKAYSVLHVTVPETWPLADFYARVCALAGCLRLRWGAAGLTYSLWEAVDYRDPFDKRYAHARRYVGFDSAIYTLFARPFYNRVRTINWLTFLGPALITELLANGRELNSTPLVDVSRIGGAALLRAGTAPEPGDRNRMRVPPAYIAADAMVRPVRARSGLDFGRPWTEATTSEWLCRFEGLRH